MRSFLLALSIAVAPGLGGDNVPVARGSCAEYEAQNEHFATALQRVSDCLYRTSKAEGLKCVNKVLNEIEY